MRLAVNEQVALLGVPQGLLNARQDALHVKRLGTLTVVAANQERLLALVVVQWVRFLDLGTRCTVSLILTHRVHLLQAETDIVHFSDVLLLMRLLHPPQASYEYPTSHVNRLTLTRSLVYQLVIQSELL